MRVTVVEDLSPNSRSRRKLLGAPAGLATVAVTAALIQLRDNDAVASIQAVEPLVPDTSPQPGATPTSLPTQAQESPKSDRDAVRFLTQATFGASSTAIKELRDVGSYDEWITHQLQLPVSLTEPYVEESGNSSLSTSRHYIWWENAIRGEDQLRQRLAFAWSQIFVVSDRDYTLSNAQFAMCNFYDMLATESTGNFRTMLERVTLSPVMGVYLTMVRNERADPTRNIRPDENFAREVLQLFTIGLHTLTSDGQVVTEDGVAVPAYDQRTVEEFAKLFTGWNFADARYWDDNNFNDKRLPMTAWPDYHEPEAKSLLRDEQVPAGGSAEADLTRALDNIFAHPNVGPYLARLLIQRLVTSNPTPGYVGRVAAVFDDDGTGERGNLASVTRAILTDPEARHGHEALPEQFGKIKEPIMRLTQLWRAFGATPGPESTDGVYRPYARPVDQIESVVGQAPMRAQSVFNFYLPDHPLGPGSDLVAPELAILAEIDVASTNNMLFQQIQGHHSRSTTRLNISKITIENEIEMASDPSALVGHLETLLLTAPLPPVARQSIVDHITSIPINAGADDGADPQEDGALLRAVDAIYAVVGSPFHLVQL